MSDIEVQYSFKFFVSSGDCEMGNGYIRGIATRKEGNLIDGHEDMISWVEQEDRREFISRFIRETVESYEGVFNHNPAHNQLRLV